VEGTDGKTDAQQALTDLLIFIFVPDDEQLFTKNRPLHNKEVPWDFFPGYCLDYQYFYHI
jgi:hypothetical protein